MSMSTKDRIIDVSIDLFSKNGYAETSIRDIAKDAEIKTSSIYYYFESKEAILNNILSKYMDIVNHDEHYRRWNAAKNDMAARGTSMSAKNDMAAGETSMSAKNIMSYMFFSFDEQHAVQNKKMLKIICSEAVRNDTVRSYEHQIINSGYQYIKSVLDFLIEMKTIPKCDTAKLATTLYSISFAFMHLTSIDMQHIGNENEGTDMFAPLEYVLSMVLESTNE